MIDITRAAEVETVCAIIEREKAMDYHNLTFIMNSPNCCQHLEDNGDRCKKKTKFRRAYHGDPEIIGSGISKWVCVELCEEHAKETFNVPNRLDGIPIFIYRKTR